MVNNLIFFYSDNNTIEENICDIITTCSGVSGIEIYKTVEALKERLKMPRGTISLLVLFTTDKKELSGLCTIQSLICDLPSILILPDKTKDSIHRGHSLYPRYISFIDSDFSDVKLVLSNLLDPCLT